MSIILCLGTDPEIIHQRKPELLLEEIRRQVSELKDFCNQNPHAVWIDTGESIDKSTNESLKAIVTRMAHRYE